MVNHMVLGTCIKLVICLALFFLFGFVLGSREGYREVTELLWIKDVAHTV